MLSRLVEVADGLAAAVVDGRTVVREVAVLGVRDAVVEAVDGLPVVVVRPAVVVEAGFLSAVDPMTLARRSVVVFAGARAEGVPARLIRFAAPEILFFSSPELATLDAFSSAELLIEARDR